jgi:hypothetical protein
MCTVYSTVYSVQSMRGTSSLFWHTEVNGESQFRRLEKKLSTLPTLWIGLQGSYLLSPSWLSLKLRKNPPRLLRKQTLKVLSNGAGGGWRVVSIDPF